METIEEYGKQNPEKNISKVRQMRTQSESSLDFNFTNQSQVTDQESPFVYYKKNTHLPKIPRRKIDKSQHQNFLTERTQDKAGQGFTTIDLLKQSHQLYQKKTADMQVEMRRQNQQQRKDVNTLIKQHIQSQVKSLYQDAQVKQTYQKIDLTKEISKYIASKLFPKISSDKQKPEKQALTNSKNFRASTILNNSVIDKYVISGPNKNQKSGISFPYISKEEKLSQQKKITSTPQKNQAKTKLEENSSDSEFQNNVEVISNNSALNTPKSSFAMESIGKKQKQRVNLQDRQAENDPKAYIQQILNRDETKVAKYLHFSKQTNTFFEETYSIITLLHSNSNCKVYLARLFVDNTKLLTVKIYNKNDVKKIKGLEVKVRAEKYLTHMMTDSSPSCPYIIKVAPFASFQDSDNYYLLLEFLQGGTLLTLLRKQKKLVPELAKSYIAQIILAIEFLHSKFIVYRNLTSFNVLLDSIGHIRIIDLKNQAKGNILYRTYTALGDLEYRAPEMIQGKMGYDFAVDWWALGILFYELLTGNPPFHGDNAMQIYDNILSGFYTWPLYCYDVKTKDLISKLLAPNPLNRYGTLINGADDIKNHKAMRKINWKALEQNQIKIPYEQHFTSPFDTSYCDVKANSRVRQANKSHVPSYFSDLLDSKYQEYLFDNYFDFF